MSERSHKSRSVQRYEVTDGYRERHGEIFGDAKPRRGRWIWDRERREMVPADEYQAPEGEGARGRLPVVTDLYMDGVRATDGTDIGSRAKRREYMSRHGLADASDYAGTWERARQRRERFLAGGGDGTRRLEETLGREIHKQTRGR